MRTKEQLLAQIQLVKMMCQSSHPLSYGKGTAEYCQTLASIAEVKGATTAAERKQRLVDTYNKGQDGFKEIASAMRLSVEVDVLASIWALAFLQLVTLADDEWPIIETKRRDGQVYCRYIGEGKGGPKHQKIDRRAHTQYLLQFFASDLVEYQLFDLQMGDLNELDRVISEVSYEMSLAIDALAVTLLDSCIRTSGLRATLNLHRSIVAANIPDTNYLDLSGVGVAGTIDLEKYKRILDYFQRFAHDVELDGVPLSINTMVMSTVQLRKVWDFASVVAAYTGISGAIVIDPKDTIPTDAKLNIWNTGGITSMFGQTFKTMTVNTLASNIMYVSSNKPCGFYFEKPNRSQVINEVTAESQMRNTGKFGLIKAQALVAPDPWNYRVLKVKL